MGKAPKPLPIDETKSVAERLHKYLRSRLVEILPADAWAGTEFAPTAIFCAAASRDPLLMVVGTALERATAASGLARRHEYRERWEARAAEAPPDDDSEIERTLSSREHWHLMAAFCDDAAQRQAMSILKDVIPRLRRLDETLRTAADESEARHMKLFKRVDTAAIRDPANRSASLVEGAEELLRLLRADPGHPDAPRSVGEWNKMLTEMQEQMLEHGAAPRDVAWIFGASAEQGAPHTAQGRIERNVRRRRKREVQED